MVSLEIHTSNVAECKDAEEIQNVQRAKHVSMENVVRHVDVASQRCVKLSITNRFANAPADTQAIQRLAAIHRQMHANQTHAVQMPCANLTAAIQFASVQKA